MNKIIKVIAKPNAVKQEIQNIDDKLIISLKSPPYKGNANLELLKILKNYFRKTYPIKNIKIIKGFKSKNKLIEISW